MDEDLGAVLSRLYQTIESRKGEAPDVSYTASLLAGGPARCAQKFGEEAVEAAIAGAGEDKAAFTEEAADVLYHLLVLAASLGVRPDGIASVLTAREGRSGHEEKAARNS